MSNPDKREMARALRAQASHILSHGLSNFFEHTFTCLHAQALKECPEERCLDCVLRPFVLVEYQDEAFPCQHITEEGWARAAETPGLAERFAARLIRRAEELEAGEARASRS